VVANATKHLARLNIPFAMVLEKPARADSELCGVAHRLWQARDLQPAPSWFPDVRQISSFGEEIVENLTSTFAGDLHSEAVYPETAHGERPP
jgi:hypothetical protein